VPLIGAHYQTLALVQVTLLGLRLGDGCEQDGSAALRQIVIGAIDDRDPGHSLGVLAHCDKIPNIGIDRSREDRASDRQSSEPFTKPFTNRAPLT